MNNEEKRKLFQYHLEAQHKKRQEILQKKKAIDQTKNNPQEDMIYIQKIFREKQKQLQDKMIQYKQKSVTFDQLLKYFGQLKQYYLEVNYVLKTYDRQTYKQTLDKLYNSIIQLKKKFEPRQKFKFSRRGQDFGVKVEQIKQVEHTSTIDKSHLNIPGIIDKTSQTIKIQQNPQKISSYKIINCTNCQIDLQVKTQILFLKQLKNCKIRCALTKSTVFVDNCTECVFELNCHQLRIHNTYKTTFCIFVTSKAIIQDCNQVIFTPYKYQYQNKEKDEIQFERNGRQNLWRQIQDFNWLKENMKSPHYDLKQ